MLLAKETVSPQKNRSFALTPSLIVRWLVVAAVNLALLWLAAQLFADGNVPLAVTLAVVALLLTVIFTVERLAAYRWLSVGIALMIVFVLYPILYTFYIATTNTSFGHVLTKAQAVASLEREQFLPEGGQQYRWMAFRSDSGEYALWLQAPDGTGYFARQGDPLEAAAPGSDGIGAADDNGFPTTIDGYTRLERRDTVVQLDPLSKLEFGEPPQTVRISSLSNAAATQQRYRFDPAQDAIIDQQTGTIYHAQNGSFISDEGQELRPGFFYNIGLDNFRRFFSSSAMRGPIVSIITWNFAYALLSVFFSFSLGLFIALLFDNLPGKKIIRTLLIIPYPIPALVSILIWRNLLNPDFGALVRLQEALGGTDPGWLTNPMATRTAIILINMWLSYPYFYIVSSGALQAIPTDMLDAAAVDGANIWQRFRHITLPLLLVIVSPLLVASFAFNFNNFNLIYIFNQGNPPIAGSPIPAGHTDILISFVYKLAFTTSQADYGLGAAISIVLFAFIAIITWLQFRYTRVLEDSH